MTVQYRKLGDKNADGIVYTLNVNLDIARRNSSITILICRACAAISTCQDILSNPTVVSQILVNDGRASAVARLKASFTALRFL